MFQYIVGSTTDGNYYPIKFKVEIGKHTITLKVDGKNKYM